MGEFRGMTLPRDSARVACLLAAVLLAVALSLSWSHGEQLVVLGSGQGTRTGWVQLGPELVVLDAAMLVCLVLAFTAATPRLRRASGIVLTAAAVGVCVWRLLDVPGVLGSDLDYARVHAAAPGPGAGAWLALAASVVGLAGTFGVRARTG